MKTTTKAKTYRSHLLSRRRSNRKKI